MIELASTMTPPEIASRAADAIRALNHLAAGGGELTSPGDVREVITSLEQVGQGLPELCEQLARFLVAQHEDGQVRHGSGRDAGGPVTEVTEALAAAGQAADMMAAALGEARTASSGLRQAP